MSVLIQYQVPFSVFMFSVQLLLQLDANLFTDIYHIQSSSAYVTNSHVILFHLIKPLSEATLKYPLGKHFFFGSRAVPLSAP